MNMKILKIREIWNHFLLSKGTDICKLFEFHVISMNVNSNNIKMNDKSMSETNELSFIFELNFTILLIKNLMK